MRRVRYYLAVCYVSWGAFPCGLCFVKILNAQWLLEEVRAGFPPVVWRRLEPRCGWR